MKSKFLLSFLTLFLLTLTLAESVYAVNELRVKNASFSATTEKQVLRNEEKQEKIVEKSLDKMVNLKKRALSEIDRRIKALSALKERVSTLKRLSDTQKAEFTAKIQTEIDSLTALRARIEADTDMDTLKTDVQSIVKSYRVFAFFLPQVQLLLASDSLAEAADLLTEHATKLDTRIAEVKATGANVTELETSLASLRSNVALVTSAASQITTSVSTLTVEGYPENKTTLQIARTSLQSARKALSAARQSAESIRKSLSNLKK